jgi:hypothetical protein
MHALDFNNAGAWSEALHNWVRFWDQIIVFKDSIFQAALQACVRFKTLLYDYHYGIKSTQTQRIFSHGTYLFSKQLMDVLASGAVFGEGEVISQLTALPDVSNGSLLANHLNSMMMEHFTAASAVNSAITRSATGTVKEPDSKKKGAKTTQTKEKSATAAATAKPRATRKQKGAGTETEDTPEFVDFCGRFLSEPGCRNPNKKCNYVHEIPKDKADMERMVRFVRDRDGELSVAFLKACQKAGVASN